MPVDEKRVLPRFPLEMPVWLRLPGSDATVHAKTRDVSASGVFFYVNCEIRQDAEIEFTMTLLNSALSWALSSSTPTPEISDT